MGRAISFALVLALTGCGTIQNLSRPEDGAPRPMKVYGGLSQSWGMFREAFIDPEAVILSPLCLPDVALSAVGDTLTLPITLAAAVQRSVTAYYLPAEKPGPNEWRKFWFNEPQPSAGERPRPTPSDPEEPPAESRAKGEASRGASHQVTGSAPR